MIIAAAFICFALLVVCWLLAPAEQVERRSLARLEDEARWQPAMPGR